MRELTIKWLVLLTTLLATSVAAQESAPADTALISERPNPPGEATDVTVGVYLIDIDEINDVDQRFSADIFVNIAWHDSRLALPDGIGNSQSRMVPADEIWTPRGMVVNDRGLSPQLPQVVDVDPLGNVVIRQRLFGELAADLDFREFPFDTQLLPIDIVSYRYSPEEVRFTPESGILGDLESFSTEGWTFDIREPLAGEFSVPAAEVVRPRITFIVEAQRSAQYYMLTMFLPMTLIIFMSWTAFWIQPNVVPPRIAISTASIFSLIAFGFSIRLGLPRVSYVTRADLFVIGCTLLVFIALAVAVIGSRWAGADKMDRALQLNAATRWVYVGLFFVVATAAATL